MDPNLQAAASALRDPLTHEEKSYRVTVRPPPEHRRLAREAARHAQNARSGAGSASRIVTTSPDKVAQTGGPTRPLVGRDPRFEVHAKGGRPGPCLASRLRHAQEVETIGSKGLRFLTTGGAVQMGGAPGRYQTVLAKSARV
jgi:hypothetical protein